MLICVMGQSGAGKSSLAKRLEQLRPDLVARVPVDFFFVPRAPNQSLDDYFAAPLNYDWDAIDRAVVADGAKRSSPDCDFTEFRRRSPHGGLPIGHGSILLLDGMRPHPRCDAIILVDIDARTQQQRLVERDRQWKATVSVRIEHLAATFAAGMAEMPRDPDLVLHASDPLEYNSAAILRFIAARWPRRN